MNFTKTPKVLAASVSAALLMAGSMSAQAGVQSFAHLFVDDFQINNVTAGRALTASLPPDPTGDVVFLDFNENSLSAVSENGGAVTESADQVTSADLIGNGLIFPGIDTFAQTPGGTVVDNAFAMGTLGTDNHVVGDTEVAGGPGLQFVLGGVDVGGVSNDTNLLAEGISPSSGNGSSDTSVSNDSIFSFTALANIDVSFSVSDIVVDQLIQYEAGDFGVSNSEVSFDISIVGDDASSFTFSLNEIFAGYQDTLNGAGFGGAATMATQNFSSGAFESATFALTSGTNYIVNINTDANIDYAVTTPVPEPGMLGLLSIGMLALGGSAASRRRRKQA